MSKTPPHVQQDDVMQHYTEGARTGIRYIRSLDDKDVLTAARDQDSAQHAAIAVAISTTEWTNPCWITSSCALEAYDRGLIDEVEVDRLVGD